MEFCSRPTLVQRSLSSRFSKCISTALPSVCTKSADMKVILIPGMKCTPITESNWYSWFAEKMRARDLECELQEFPDAHKCRESIWIPHVKSLIGDAVDETILVGHSSGAACAMRLLEEIEPAGVILVAAAYTDLGDDGERESEYFNRPWDWETMKKRRNVVMFHSEDDPLIPVAEARHIKEQLGNGIDYREMKNKSHFFRKFEEILAAVDRIVTARGGTSVLADKVGWQN